MANNTNPFAFAHTQKIELTEQTTKRIQLIYRQSAEEINRELKKLQIVNPSDNLKKIYLEGLVKDIEKSSDSFNRMIQNTIKDAGEKAGQIAVDAGNKMMAEAGLDIKSAFSYIPRREMLNIASGKLYGDKWSLSSAIWKNSLRTKSDIEKIVAKGLAENKSIKEIADALTKYVDPTARKPWDWGKVYPGTAQKVDYNAQRLARTMIQHAYQASLVQQQKDNPFCKGIIWHSVGLHGRTCEMCEQMDGQTFPAEQLPLDHPNGLCYFEPALDSMNNIADRLADWVNGKDDPALDNYVAKAFSMNTKIPAAKRNVNMTKKSVKPAKSVKPTYSSRFKKGKPIRSSMNKSKYVDKNFKNLQKKVVQSQKTKAEGEKIWKALSTKMKTLSPDQLRYMKTGEKRLNSILYNSEKAFFQPTNNTITMDLVKDMNNAHGKGAFTTFFHEYGHLLDHNAVKANKGLFTNNVKFRETLYSSLEKEYNKLCGDFGGLKSSVKKDLLKSNASNGVQDIISGVSLNTNRVKWGHDTDYWHKGQGQKERVVTETMAHFNAAWANPEAYSYMQKYFPESYNYIQQEVLTYIRKVVK